jgi:hypothetical protein
MMIDDFDRRMFLFLVSFLFFFYFSRFFVSASRKLSYHTTTNQTGRPLQQLASPTAPKHPSIITTI